MIMKTSTSPLDAIRGVLALRRETYAVEHKFEYWVWALAVSSAALSCQIHELVTTLASRFKPDRSYLEPRHQIPQLNSRGHGQFLQKATKD
jgi:hypothetical protein